MTARRYSLWVAMIGRLSSFPLTFDGKEYCRMLPIPKAIALHTRCSHFAEGNSLPPSRFQQQATHLDVLFDLSARFLR